MNRFSVLALAVLLVTVVGAMGADRGTFTGDRRSPWAARSMQLTAGRYL